MKIGRKISLGFIGVALLMSMVGFFGLKASRDVLKSQESNKGFSLAASVAATDASSYLKRAEGHLMLFFTLGDEVDKGKFYLRSKSLREQIAILEGIVVNPAAVEMLDDIKANADVFYKTGDSLVKRYNQDIANKGSFEPENHTDLFKTLYNASSTIRRRSVELNRFNIEGELMTRAAAFDELASIQRYTSILILSCVLIAIVLGSFLSRTIATPLRRLMDAATEIGKGNLNLKVEVGSHDEVSQLGISFNRMVDDLRSSRDELETKVRERTTELSEANKALSEDVIKRKQTEKALRESEEYLAIAQKIAHLGHWKLDPKTNEIIGSDELYRIFDLITERATLESFLARIHPDDRDVFLAAVNKGVEHGEPWDIEYRLLIDDETIRTVHGVGSAITDEEGKTDFLVGTVHDVTERKVIEEKLKELMATDELTGIANRRSYNKTIEVEWRRAKRNKTPISVLMIDIDYFKAFNDSLGHLFGDECLHNVAQALKSRIVRAIDLLARYGGEEFVIILPETDIAGAGKLAEKLRKKVESLEIKHPGSKTSDYVTISIGVASTIPGMEDLSDALVSAADDALYAAKQAGRNCVKISDRT